MSSSYLCNHSNSQMERTWLSSLKSLIQKCAVQHYAFSCRHSLTGSICCDAARWHSANSSKFVFPPDPRVIYSILIQHVCFGARYVFGHETINRLENTLKNELADVCVWVLYVPECVRLCECVCVCCKSLEAHAVTQPSSQGGLNTEPFWLSHTRTHTYTHRRARTNIRRQTNKHSLVYM